MTENEISKIVFEVGLKVHKRLGPGLLESVYKECMCYELCKSGLGIVKEKAVPLIYEEVHLEVGYRVDLMVENKFVVEIKSIECLTDLHMAQLLTYLRLSGCKLGMLINFRTVYFKDGVRRVINGMVI